MTVGLTANLLRAQVNVNININSQPDWGPRGYNYVESYYLPEYDIYYNVPKHRYYYFSGNRWLYSSVLPVSYRHINLYRTHKVVLVDRYPFKRHKVHYKQYAKYRGNHAPRLIAGNNGYHYKSKPFKKNVRNKHFNSPVRKYAKIGHPANKGFHHKNFNRPKPNKHHKGGPNKHR
ncbi:hypothetical protein GCM10007332_11180 [Epilithonimonas arachidiradicis]|nr:hypothetical protein GCM10007332_11180 [Epilithonimonas arachidiradicis]